MGLTRRRCLALASAGGALAAMAPGCSLARRAGPRSGGTPRFGLVTWMWGAHLELPALVATCEEAGLDGVELRTTHRHGVELLLSKAQRAEVRARFADSPVELVGIGTDERFDSPEPNGLASAVELTRLYLELSRDVGGSGVKVKPDSFHEGVPRERTIAQIASGLESLAPYAAELGQELRLEVHGTCSELPTIRAILDRAPHPAVRVCWNSNATDLAGQGLEHNFGLVRERFGATLHVRRLDSEGYPWGELMRLLRETQWGGSVLLEQAGDAPADLVAALREQRALFDRWNARTEGEDR